MLDKLNVPLSQVRHNWGPTFGVGRDVIPIIGVITLPLMLMGMTVQKTLDRHPSWQISSCWAYPSLSTPSLVNPAWLSSTCVVTSGHSRSPLGPHRMTPSSTLHNCKLVVNYVVALSTNTIIQHLELADEATEDSNEQRLGNITNKVDVIPGKTFKIGKDLTKISSSTCSKHISTSLPKNSKISRASILLLLHTS